MADTAVAVTAGTGTNIDTRTEATNGNHRQVVVLGDPSVNAGVAPVDATNGLSVNVTNATLTVASHAVTNAGTFATQSAVTAAASSIADGALVTIGSKTDAKATSTDATSVSAMQVLKQISASVQAPPSQAVTNAGTFLVQENGALLTSAQLLDDTITAQGTALGTTKTSLTGASVTTAAPTYTTGQISPLSMDTTGALRVTGAGGGTQYTEDVAAAADPVGSVMMAVRRDTPTTSEVSADGDNVALKADNKGQLRVVVDSSQLGALGQTTMSASQPVVIASDQTSFPVTNAAGTAIIGKVGIDQTTVGTTNGVSLAQIGTTTTATGSGAMNAGTQRVAMATDSPGIVTLGQTTKSASVPMVIASDQLGIALNSASVPVTMVPAVGALGSYSMAANSGTMAAGLGAAAPIIAFRTGASNLYIIKRIIFSAGNTATAFTAGVVTFNLFAARSFSASDTGGTALTLTGNNGKLRTSHATTGIVDFRASSTATLTAGTRTLDATPIGSFSGSVPAVAGSLLVPVGTALFEAGPTHMPLILAASEGFVIQATVPATGTWTFSVRVYWDEVTAF